MNRKPPAQGEAKIPAINRTLQYFSASLLAIIVTLTVVQLALARVKLLGDTRQRMSRVDMVLAEQTGRVLETVDFILRNAMETALPHGMQPDAAVDLLMAHRIEDVRQVSEIAIADPSGRIAFSSRPGGAAELPAVGRPLLAYHASHADSTTQVSEPFRDGDGQWRMLLTRRMNGPSGQFLGIGLAFFDLSYLQNFYGAVKLGDDGTILLHRDDGVILARSPPDNRVIGTRQATLAESRNILANTGVGTLETADPLHRGGRIMAIQALKAFPLAISVSVSKAKVLAAWWQQVWIFALACLVACTALAGLLLQLLRRTRQVALLVGQLRAQRDQAQDANRDLSEQIAQREQAEAALQETNAELHRQKAETADANKWLGLAEQIAHIGHWRLTLPDKTLVWSPEIYRMFGQPIETFRPVHGSPDLSYHGDDQQIINRAIAESIARRIDFQVRVRIDRPDGSICHIVVRGIPQIDPDGKLTSLFGVIVNRTDQHRFEEQLRQSEKVQVVGRLAAGVAHDFNNILQVIISNLEMIEEDLPQQSPAIVYSRNALQEAMRGADLTHHLLSYTRQQVLTPRLLELPGLLTEVQVILARTLGSRVTLDLVVEPLVAWVRVDRAQLQTALMNLGINAAHAMPDGGMLRLEAYSAGAEVFGEIRPGNHVVIAVTDTGCGMTPEVLERAFDPFFTTKGLEGTGLGLAMVQGFSRQSGGDVRILSTPGKGTRVEIWLPAVLPEGGSAAALPVRRQKDAGRVLLVDDQPSVLALEATILRKAGFAVSEAPSGAGALALLAAGKRFDTLVTDYMMPGMSGVDLIRHVRAIQPALPAVIVTGYTELAEFDPGRLGAVLIHKPFKREALVAQIHELVDEARRHTAPGGAAASVPL